jgi:hypothetical protein
MKKKNFNIELMNYDVIYSVKYSEVFTGVLSHQALPLDPMSISYS